MFNMNDQKPGIYVELKPSFFPLPLAMFRHFRAEIDNQININEATKM